jgi:hypothetical protein
VLVVGADLVSAHRKHKHRKYFYHFDVGARFIEPAKDRSDKSDPYNKSIKYRTSILSSILLSSPLRGRIKVGVKKRKGNLL